MNKESICRNCFHSYVCEQFNENKDDNNTKCHFANDHYIPTADVAPKSEVEEWVSKCRDWHEVAELKSQRIVELEAELSKAKAEVALRIFGEIDKLSREFMNNEHYIFGDMLWDIAELKKKYSEEQ